VQVFVPPIIHYPRPKLQSIHAGFDDKQEVLEHYETMMGSARPPGVSMDLVTDAMALVGQHGVYCQSQRWPGKPVMDFRW